MLKPLFHVLVSITCVLAMSASALPQNTAATATVPGGTIHGTVKSGNTPIPGVTMAAANTLTGKKVVSSTDIEGMYSLTVPSNGRYVIRAELSGFASATKEVLINASSHTAQIDLDLVLLSRVPKPDVQETMRVEQAGDGQSQNGSRAPRRLNLDEAGIANDNGTQSETPLQGMPAFANSAEAGNQSVSVAGIMGQTQDMGRDIDDVRERIEEMRARGDLPGFQDDRGGGPGGPGGGGFGGPGGPGVFMIGGARGRGPRGGPGGFNVNTIHGSVFYNLGNAALDAAPYSLHGPAHKPDYSSNRFGATIGGPLRIPRLFEAGKNTFFFFNMFGTRATNPYQAFSTVPTDAERAGIGLVDPRTGQAIDVPAINSVAQILLDNNYIPHANLPGQRQNFVYSGSALNDSTNIGVRIMHSFSSMQAGARPGGFSRMGRNSINFAFNYTSGSNDLLRPLPSVAGKSKSQGLNVSAGYTVTHGKWTNNLRATFNQSKSKTQNLYAGVNDIGAALGIPGVSTSPADWGLPDISFSTGYLGINDIAPADRRSRTLQFNDTLIWRRGKHNVRFGGDFRRMWIDLRNDPNPNGTFVFTGHATGNDFADFLLGLPAQATVQYSMNAYAFHANGYDVFVMDDWRLRSNLTLNLGLRYEYVAPFGESNDQLVNLAVTPGFAQVDTVRSGQPGYPTALINPDRNNFAPRVGIAWKPLKNTVVRAGYSINYNNGQYRNIVQQLAFQPPFAFTETLTAATLPTPLTFSTGFSQNTLTNNYGVDPNYRLGYVQMWNLNVQRELSTSTVVNVGYTGSKGTALDIVRAPDPSLANVAPFLWETSQGFSILHAGSVRLRKRLQHGVAFGATYTYSKSIDNASSIGGGATVVAQNDLNLSAERGLSSFDQRHRFTGDWTFDLPFGSGRKWLAGGGPLARVLGDWQWNANFTIASGTPYTAHVLGNNAAISRGANGSLRADYTGQPIALADPSIREWFNTAAFSNQCTADANGIQTCPLGTAGRNTIIGPGTLVFNMSISKNFPIKDTTGLELRADASNIFNTPQYASIDTVVNSRTFGQVLSVGVMRQIKMSMRFRF